MNNIVIDKPERIDDDIENSRSMRLKMRKTLHPRASESVAIQSRKLQ